jgi:hypothetical protein
MWNLIRVLLVLKVKDHISILGEGKMIIKVMYLYINRYMTDIFPSRAGLIDDALEIIFSKLDLKDLLNVRKV